MYKIPANTLFVGKNLVYVPVCHSTNTLAAELSIKTPLSEGTLIITDNQQAGRGQRGNGWEAEPGKNLTFSIVLKPTFLAISDQFLLNQCISLAITDSIQGLLVQEVKIKWPNDIIVSNKKVGGILIENNLSNLKIEQSIIGIGLNINQQKFQAELASSLSVIGKTEFSLSGILEMLLENVEARYLQLKRSEFSSIKSDYLSKLFQINQANRYLTDGKEFEGVITGVDERGRLKIQSGNAHQVFDVKQVSFIF